MIRSRRSLLLPLGLLALGSLGSATLAGDADAGPSTTSRGRARFHPDWEKHASTRYGAMDASACTAELDRRGVAYTRVAAAPGVRTPVRLPKDVGGVLYRTEAPQHLRDAGPYDVFDCRLVLALSDFSRVLAAHDIDEVRMFSAWRPPGSRWDPDREGTRHAGGLAMDAGRFGKKLAPGQTERVWLEVERDYHGRLGAPSCGSGAAPPVPATAEARELRSIACEAADQHFFTSILTPNYDRAHHNHFHLEITPDVRWYLVL